MSEHCPELEQLFAEAAEGDGPLLEHAHQCERCSGLLEEHRQLEKDLFRLADPLPPPDFTQQVMARVAKERAPMHVNIPLGLAIALTTLGLGIFTLVAAGVGPSAIGILGGSALIAAQSLLLATGKALHVLWDNAALPVSASLFGLLMFCVLALKRLLGASGALSEARISG
jgi:hypothetical protein